MSSSTALATPPDTRESSEMPITIAPIPIAFLNRVRHEGLDDLGQPVKRVEAQGGEPCRDVLRRAQPGEQLILASFTPFTKPGPYHEIGVTSKQVVSHSNPLPHVIPAKRMSGVAPASSNRERREAERLSLELTV
jgi:hypothetical protein